MVVDPEIPEYSGGTSREDSRGGDAHSPSIPHIVGTLMCPRR